MRTTTHSHSWRILTEESLYKNKKKWDDRQTDREKETGELYISSYSRGHERSRKCKSRESADGLDYNTSFAYAWVVKIMS